MSKEDNAVEKDQDGAQAYNLLAALWQHGTNAYGQLFSCYLVANSIFVAAMCVLLSSQETAAGSAADTWLLLILCLTGIFVAFQMAVSLNRFRCENILIEHWLREEEALAKGARQRFVSWMHEYREDLKCPPARADIGEPPSPNWALKLHRRWWASRAKSFPWLFMVIYLVLLLVGLL